MNFLLPSRYHPLIEDTPGPKVHDIRSIEDPANYGRIIEARVVFRPGLVETVRVKVSCAHLQTARLSEIADHCVRTLTRAIDAREAELVAVL